MFRDILVHVDGGQAGRRGTQLAVDLAASMGAHLSGLHVTPPAEVPLRFKPSHVPEVAADMTTNLALDERASAMIFWEETHLRAPDSRWFEAHGDVAQGISERARYADLVILGQYEWQGAPETHPLPIAHSVVLRCGRPVLVVPADAQVTELQTICVAWDGSREAVRAVHDALPLLRLSSSVQIVTMIDPSTAERGQDANSLSAHLTNHGVKVGPDTLEVRTAQEHASLRRQVEQGNYDLLVMGGYSHPVWLEFIFGGATQSILLSAKIPVLVSH